MKFRKMVTITLFARQEKRHRCTQQIFGLCGRRRGWEVLRNSIKACILSRVKQITSPGWMHETSARGWCTGKTQRDEMGREVEGGGSGWGTHVDPWLIHVNVCKYIAYTTILQSNQSPTNKNKWKKNKGIYKTKKINK